MVNDFFRTALVGKLANQEIVTVWHWQQISANATVNDDYHELANAIINSWMGAFVALQSQDVTYSVLEVRNFPIPPVPLAGYDADFSAYVGTDTHASLPPATAAVMRKRTQYLGRKYRGRMFLPGIPVNVVTGGVITDATYIANLVGFQNDFATPIQSGNVGAPLFAPVVAAYVKTGTPPVITSVRSNIVLTCDWDLRLRTQRRREVGRGV